MKPMRTALPAILLGLACLYTYKLEIPETRSWPGSGIARISVSTGNGHISVTAAADTVITGRITRRCFGRDKADAENAIRNVVVRDTIEGEQLRLWADMPGGNRTYGAYYEITARESTRLTLSTSNGSISLTGMLAGADAATSNAGVNLLNTKGQVNVGTSNGAVTVQVHRGPISVSTSHGAIDCDLAELSPTQAASLSTSDGKVTLLLPADISASFDAQTSNGNVTVSGFNVVDYEVSERAHKRGRIGSGAASVFVKTSNADIIIRAR